MSSHLSPQKPWFNPRAFCVESVVEELPMRQVPLRRILFLDVHSHLTYGIHSYKYLRCRVNVTKATTDRGAAVVLSRINLLQECFIIKTLTIPPPPPGHYGQVSVFAVFLFFELGLAPVIHQTGDYTSNKFVMNHIAPRRLKFLKFCGHPQTGWVRFFPKFDNTASSPNSRIKPFTEHVKQNNKFVNFNTCESAGTQPSYSLDGMVLAHWWGNRISLHQNCPHRFRGPPSLLFNNYLASFPAGMKRQLRELNQLSEWRYISTRPAERVKLYLYSTSWASEAIPLLDQLSEWRYTCTRPAERVKLYLYSTSWASEDIPLLNKLSEWSYTCTRQAKRVKTYLYSTS
jgi:hypothetical protein